MKYRFSLYPIGFLCCLALLGCFPSELDFEYPYDDNTLVVYSAIENYDNLRFESYQLLAVEQYDGTPISLAQEVFLLEDGIQVASFLFDSSSTNHPYPFEAERAYSIQFQHEGEMITSPPKYITRPIPIELDSVIIDTSIFGDRSIAILLNILEQGLQPRDVHLDFVPIYGDALPSLSNRETYFYSSGMYQELSNEPLDQIEAPLRSDEPHNSWLEGRILLWRLDEDMQRFWSSVDNVGIEYGFVSGIYDPPVSNLNHPKVIGFFGAVSSSELLLDNPLPTKE